ncbi:hypothetical protein DNTS_033358 [Danionella cerebrum]|uniref:Ribosomal protein eL8/eL30/eS12/Gadd45 domain-containing protein n=1 Tax=Danionella cerebrum TaxID=2873325 RepID=A0A553QJT1_9TELE|nr:hypothetical protein DNTS_033358 [Danionella translucida]
MMISLAPKGRPLCQVKECPDVYEWRKKQMQTQLTVAVVGVLCSGDGPRIINGEEPLCSAVKTSNPHVSSLHVVIVPGVSLVSEAVVCIGLFYVANTQTHSAEDQQHVHPQLRNFPLQSPSAHYTKLLLELEINIVKARQGFSASLRFDFSSQWIEMQQHHLKDVKLSAEVEPFIPQKKVDASLLPMSLCGEAGGDHAHAQIPSYLITCYPFVQENQSGSRPMPVYSGGDQRWPPLTPSYPSYLLSPHQPPLAGDYAHYYPTVLPPPCPPVLGFYQPFPGPYALLNTGPECTERPLTPRGRGTSRAPLPIPKQQPIAQPIRTQRPVMRSVAVQKEICAPGADGKSRTVLLVDAAQQTDFPGEASSSSLRSEASPQQWKSSISINKPRRRRASHQESSSEHGTSEADIDSDSGYCSPKHHQQGATSHKSTGNNTKPWTDRNTVYQRGAPEQRIHAQVSFGGGLGGPRRTPSEMHNTQTHTPEPLYFQDEEEFPDLSIGAAQKNSIIKPEAAQSKLTKSLLENLPESSPISIVQTPIPITSSVPKRAKSQRKKALAAAIATAQEYNEISMEQRKLQDALTKAAGKKSRTPVQLDLGDMLAALEKQQQAMKARQLNNTKPLSYTVGTVGAIHTKDGSTRGAALKDTPSPPHNILDSTAPRIKRGKEKEIPRVKKTTAMKKIILQEREVKKGKGPGEQGVSGAEEQRETLSFSDTLTQEQEENGLSVPSDASLSPASQNSPYSITPVSQGSPASSGLGSPMASTAKIHSRRFREYCNQVLSKEIDESVSLLLQELVRFQECVYQRDSGRGKAKRRLVMGLREVTKHMKLRKIKCVIISPNCEKIQAKGGLDEALYNVISMAREQEIPFVFALGRKALGRCVNKLVPVSVVGIFNYSGAEDLFGSLVSQTEEARRAYQEMVNALEQEQEEALRNLRSHTNTHSHHMGHSRNPSAASAISFCSVISEPISEVNEKEYETNWRSMVENTDAPEPLESEPSSTRTSKEHQEPSSPPPPVPSGPAPIPSVSPRALEREDRLEWASQQSTETGSIDDQLHSSITSTTSTLVPGSLEEEDDEEEDDEEEEEEDYSSQALPGAPLRCRIESWVSETLENLQLHRPSSEEEDDEEEEEEEGEDSSDLTEPAVSDEKEEEQTDLDTKL